MGDEPFIQNNLSGSVGENAVQAGQIHGDVVFNPRAEQRSPEEAETQRRWVARQQRILDEEEAERRRRQQRTKSFVRACRWRAWLSFLLLFLLSPTTLDVLTTIKRSVYNDPSPNDVPLSEFVSGFLWLSAMGIILIIGFRSARVLWRRKLGRPIKVPD
ncbi:hypothetical protein AB0O47_06150 [Streptomyces noursei]|uniref:hypothetical protein n=1 Tax=Streptomyces noursei TaxID=1971 RepID=UPI00344C5271